MKRTPATRQRPRAHTGKQPAEVAIFDATERLLQEHAIHELSVAKIIEEAGLSRASFYHYFGSKFDVLVALMARIFDEIFETTHTELEEPWADPGEALRSTLGRALESWEAHRAVMHATFENMHAVPELEQTWSAVRDRFVGALSEQITHEREAGRAVGELPPQTTAMICVMAAERIFYVGSSGLDPHLQTTTQRLEAIVAVALSAIYGDPRGPVKAAA